MKAEKKTQLKAMNKPTLKIKKKRNKDSTKLRKFRK